MWLNGLIPAVSAPKVERLDPEDHKSTWSTDDISLGSCSLPARLSCMDCAATVLTSEPSLWTFFCSLIKHADLLCIDQTPLRSVDFDSDGIRSVIIMHVSFV